MESIVISWFVLQVNYLDQYFKRNFREPLIFNISKHRTDSP